MIAIAVLAIGYLLANYTSKRRSTYYRYRCMGADKGQVRKMILTECLYATLPAVCLGFMLACAIFWTILRMRSDSLVQESNTVTGKDLKRLGRRARKTKYPDKDFLRRYGKSSEKAVPENRRCCVCLERRIVRIRAILS